MVKTSGVIKVALAQVKWTHAVSLKVGVVSCPLFRGYIFAIDFFLTIEFYSAILHPATSFLLKDGSLLCCRFLQRFGSRVELSIDRAVVAHVEVLEGCVTIEMNAILQVIVS